MTSYQALQAIYNFVQEQAEDEGLWSVPAEGTQPIGEAYLQQELRKLHELIEAVHYANKLYDMQPKFLE